jgi:recombinational DNA repair protein (RecF pathway)
MTISTKTVGIILRKRVLKDADISLAIFTQAHGKISVMAKGVRHLTSRRRGSTRQDFQ